MDHNIKGWVTKDHRINQFSKGGSQYRESGHKIITGPDHKISQGEGNFTGPDHRAKTRADTRFTGAHWVLQGTALMRAVHLSKKVWLGPGLGVGPEEMLP